ncbi:PREDICTED: phosphoinositide phosphatase SAC2-like isoform X1 [Brassica oleracea var. oleracea]|uniref:SAC domain-containing protein n=1 Tax=Brassica oleracea var. oleracea TaxID=109376 RepID=A0A0D3ADR5_BRAOL|nr:PREDICTED: phosphoinositide phosphatase SAC2-like isoform X1 [Brassica oleracea var. oleracea]
MAASERSMDQQVDTSSSFLQKFRLYETRSNFYMIGRDKNRTFWRVFKLDRTEQTELNFHQDSTPYTESECFETLRRIHEGNRSTGGLKFVTTCYGIIGFIRFLGPYYMLIITKRSKLGEVCGHTVYGVAKSRIVTIPHASVLSTVAYSKDEKRYKRLLCTVDLTKDFFFSYSYHIMHSLQRNLSNNVEGQTYYESMFVWNEYLTRRIRNNAEDCMWTVALVYGFFKQAKLSVSEKNFRLTLIARRSRHYAGTRYLKRGVNEKGRVANDVETEQIVYEEPQDGHPVRISSVVQNRGSIPLFWSQETSRLNIKPDITLSAKDPNFEATRLHFENLARRYGNPIIVLNLIKTREKRPRETILRVEFANAIKFINKGLSKEERLRPLHWDLHKHSRKKGTNVLGILGRLATYALNLTGIFYCQLTSDGFQNQNPSTVENNIGECSTYDLPTKDEIASDSAVENGNDSKDRQKEATMLQKGVLRTNCIDCLDRTNVAQYAYGLVAFGRQLHALGLTESDTIDLDNPLAEDLMGVYETMGDTLALQYGGSAAHNKIFCERRGQWKAATQSQELFRTLQRYYSNAYMDAEKQDAINLFLGYFQPQPDKPALWELGSDQHYNAARFLASSVPEISRSTMKRSLSESSILSEGTSTVAGRHGLGEKDEVKGLSDSAPEIISASKTTSMIAGSFSAPPPILEEIGLDEILENDCFCFNDDRHGGDQCTCAAFDMDWVSSSGASCEDESNGRSALVRSFETIPESTNIEPEICVINTERDEVTTVEGEAISGIPQGYVRWVMDEEEGHFW